MFHIIELNSCWEFITRRRENIGDWWIVGCPSLMFIILDAVGNIIPVIDEDDMCVSVAWSDDDKDLIQVANLTLLWAIPLLCITVLWCWGSYSPDQPHVHKADVTLWDFSDRFQAEKHSRSFHQVHIHRCTRGNANLLTCKISSLIPVNGCCDKPCFGEYSFQLHFCHLVRPSWSRCQ